MRSEDMMPTYFLSCDLRKNERYEDLHRELERLNAVPIHKSLWIFDKTDTTAERLKNLFLQYIDNDEWICVIEANDWAAYNDVPDNTPFNFY